MGSGGSFQRNRQGGLFRFRFGFRFGLLLLFLEFQEKGVIQVQFDFLKTLGDPLFKTLIVQGDVGVAGGWRLGEKEGQDHVKSLAGNSL
jgi:hypothetical protein